MRSKLGNALKKQFESCLKARCSGFQRIRVAGSGPDYALLIQDKLALYLCLRIDPKIDSFMVLVGFGNFGALPQETLVQERDIVFTQPGLVRLPYFVSQPYRDVWWDVDPKNYLQDPEYMFKPKTTEEECLARIPVLLDDVFAKLETHAVPYWKEVASRHGASPELPGTWGLSSIA